MTEQTTSATGPDPTTQTRPDAAAPRPASDEAVPASTSSPAEPASDDEPGASPEDAGEPGPGTAAGPGAGLPATPATVADPDPDPDPGPDAGPRPGPHPTAPVGVPPGSRAPRAGAAARRGPLTRMGPWAPVAGALVGVLAGVLVVLLLAGSVAGFADRLALAFTVVGLGMLGAAGALLADEVRMIRNGTRGIAVRPGLAEATAALLTGFTPARLLLVAAAFVLFLAAYLGR